MLNERIFTLITRLMTSRWARHYDEHHSPYEDSTMARLGPCQLTANCCFILDHCDAGVSLTLPLPGGKLYLSYTVCQGEELIRQSGWRVWWQRPCHRLPHTRQKSGRRPAGRNRSLAGRTAFTRPPNPAAR